MLALFLPSRRSGHPGRLSHHRALAALARAITAATVGGTSAPIPLEDPQFAIVVPVRAFGQFGLHIVDAGCFVIKLVGTLPRFDQDAVVDHFKGILVAQLASMLAKTMSEQSLGILQIQTQLLELSAAVEQAVAPDFED